MTRTLAKGAKKNAESNGVGHIQLNAEATLEIYLMKHVNNYFVGITDVVSVKESIGVKIEYSDGRAAEQRTIL
jgi:hypothetical protein